METIDGLLTQIDFDEIYSEIISLEYEQKDKYTEERETRILELKKKLGLD